ncbi:hypothetical protein TRFO_41509 [Tritrichomonas foetus]|uniref:C2 NT-type domain-containing protein n=1 Tax=Tritrichomonas foetus TaxID=1144522 RepID=A0A1J4L025_9EUKA|nr:hypothetical protein TRFO_41509 [Tritrichomonas foetus]|eukprot:OHT16863.1 hypothetical protein TRFO_41509 [Tritrichomonas foetus]
MNSGSPHQSKDKYTFTLVLESLQILENDDSPYFIKLKYIKKIGTTEHYIPSTNGMINLQKEFTFAAKKHTLKKNHSMTIKIIQCLKKNKKIGQIKVDLYQHLDKISGTTKTVPFRNHHSDDKHNRGNLTFSIFSKRENNKDHQITQNKEEIASLIEATNDAASHTTRKTTSVNFGHLQMNNGLNIDQLNRPGKPKLADMLNTEVKLNNKNQNIAKREQKKSLTSLNEFLSSNRKGPILPASASFGSIPLHKQTSLIEPKNDKDHQIDQILSEFDHILNLKIEYSDNQIRSFEGPDSFIFAQCLSFQLFSDVGDEVFSEIVKVLPKKICDSLIISTFNDQRRKFFPLYGLSALLKQPPSNLKNEIKLNRTTQVFDALQPKTLEYLKKFTFSYANLFELHAQSVIDNKSDNEKLIEDIRQIFDAYLIACQAPKEFEFILSKAIFAAFDSLLLQFLLNRTNVTFLDSISWNSFCTRFRENFSCNLSLFSQAVQVIQMTSVIDKNPKEINNISNKLTPYIILQILKKREIDDSLTTKPDITKFINCWEIKDEHCEIDFQSLFNWEKLLMNSYQHVHSDNWKDVNIPAQFECKFPLLNIYFAD